MSDKLIELNVEDKDLTEFVDPFNKENIKEIWFVIRKQKEISSKGIEYIIMHEARVEFVKNKTEGTQKIKAKDFTSLVQKTQAFINSL